MHERAGERELLFHSSGQLIREPRAKSRELRHVEQPIAALSKIAHAVNLREERDVLVDAQIAVQTETLREVADLTGHEPVFADRIATHDAHLAGIGTQQSTQQPNRCRLASAVGTDQTKHLAAIDRE